LQENDFIIIRERECDWQKRCKSPLPRSPISSLLYSTRVHTRELLQEILKDNVYGFAVVDIIPGPETKKFIDLNWLPIIRHDEIQFSDIAEYMQRPELQKTFPRRTLVQTLHATEILLHTRLIQWYVENGFTITKIHRMFEYQKFKCYKDVHDSVYLTRVQATIDAKNGDPAANKKATAIKLVSNSMYGQMIMVIISIYVILIFHL